MGQNLRSYTLEINYQRLSLTLRSYNLSNNNTGTVALAASVPYYLLINTDV